MTAQIESKEPPLVADPQDPLPESNWLWRRLLSFGIVVFVAWQLHLAGNRIARRAADDVVVNALVDLCHWLIVAWLVTVLLYMIAPSAEQVAKILATLSAWKSGISTLTTSRVVTPQGTAETKAAAGPASPVPVKSAEPPENAPWA